MNRNDSVFNELKDILTNYLESDEMAESIKMESHLVDELGIDSLDVVEIVVDIENQFEITVEDHLIEEMKQVKDIVKVINKKLIMVM